MSVAALPAVALGELLRSMADDEFVIGFSDSEWTGIAPLLEEDVAMSSLAQDELGHAAALYGLLGELTDTDPDALAYDREPAAYRHCRLLDHGRGDWAMTIARRFLYDTADGVRLDALVGGSWAPLAELVGEARPRGALPPDACRHLARSAGPWRRRIARSRLVAALTTLRTGRRDRVRAAPRRGGPDRRRDPPGADGRARTALAGCRSSPPWRGSICRCRHRRATRRGAGSTTARHSAGCGRSSTRSAAPNPGATW